MVEVQTEQGDVFEFQDGTPETEIAEAVDAYYAEPARSAAEVHKTFGDQVSDIVLEGMSSMNRGALSLFDIPPTLFNAFSDLAGSDVRASKVTELPGIREGTQGGFMEGGTARGAVRIAGEVLGGTASAVSGLAANANRVANTSRQVLSPAVRALPSGSKSAGLSQTESLLLDPSKVLAREAQSGALFAAGAGGASLVSENDPVAEIAGGLLAASRGAPVRLGSSFARGIGQAGKQAFSKKAARDRAVMFLKQHAEDPDQAIKNLRRSLSAKKTGTLAQLSGDEGIAAVENRLISSAPSDIGARIRISDDAVMDDIVRAYDDVANIGKQGEASDFLKARVNNSLLKINKVVQNATDEAASVLERAGTPLETPDASSRLFGKIDDALTGTRAIEDEAWSKVASDLLTPTSNVKKGVQRALNALSGTGRRAVSPKIARELKLVDSLADNVHPKELADLRGEILSASRAARDANASANVLKVLDDMQKSVQEALDTTSTASSYRAAAAVTRKKHELFNDGLLGRIRRAKDTVPENIGDKLLRTDGVGGSLADEVTRIDSELQGGLTPALEDMIRASFGRTVGEQGVLNANLSQKFLSRHQTLLSRFPKLRDELADATQAQKLVDRVTQAGAARARYVQKSRAALYSEFSDHKRAVQGVLSTKDPVRAVNSLARSASRDPTGGAALGLKRDFVESVMERILIPTAKGIKPTSSYKKEWGKLHKVLSETDLFSENEVKALDGIVKDIDRLLIRNRVPGIKENLQEDVIALALGQITGARIGAKFGTTPLIAAGLGRKFAQKVLQRMPRDRTMGFVEDMILNPQNFDEFSQAVSTASNQDQLLSALNGWALHAGVRPVTDSELAEVLSDEVELSVSTTFDTDTSVPDQ